MDQEMLAAVESIDKADRKRVSDLQIRVLGGDRIEIQTPQGSRRITLKPLTQLYGPGNPGIDIDPEGDTFMPLFFAIEEVIVTHYRSDRSLTDAQATSALDRLGLQPDAVLPPAEILAGEIQLELRLLLSMTNFSRQEVRAAIRRIGRSVTRHTRADGPQGYLTFIDKFIPR